MAVEKRRMVVAGGDSDASPVMFVEQITKPRATAARTNAQVALRRTSPIASEAARLGLQALHKSGTTFLVHLPPGMTTGDLARSSTAGMYRGFVHDGRSISAQADLEKIAGAGIAALGPQLAWAAAAYVVGQHFQIEVSQKLDELQATIEQVHEGQQNDRFGTLGAAHSLTQQALALALDGRQVPDSTIDLAHRDAIKILKTQQRWLKKFEALAQGLGGRDHKATDYLKAFGDLNDNRFAADIALTAAAINVAREVLHTRELINAASDADPYGHYASNLGREMRDVESTAQRLTSLLHVLGRLPFATEDRALYKINKNPSAKAVQAQRRALELEEAAQNWLLCPMEEPTSMTLTVEADGRIALGPAA